MLSTQDFLKTHIHKIFEDFKKNSWCEIDTRLDAESYSDICNQQYYLLKYFFAYFTEYYDLFTDFFSSFDKKMLNVISIGCGSGIDYDALNLCKIDNSLDIDIQYKGIDIIDWNYKSDFIFIKQDIITLNKKIFKDVDLIIFPKILTELTEDELDKLATKIVSAKRPLLYFINSYITDDSSDSNRINGIKQFKIICKAMEDSGYKIKNDTTCDTYQYFKKQKGLRSLYPFFIYPDNIQQYINKLKENCQRYNVLDINCNSCDLKIFPMMSNKYIANNIFKFEL